MKGKTNLYFLLTFLSLWPLSCAPKVATSILIKDVAHPPPLIQKIIAQEGKVDYFLLQDEGYSWRLIFLCANKVYNLVDDPPHKPVLVSFHPILGSEVEGKIPPLDRIKIWACLESKVREEQTKQAEIKKIIIAERKRVAEEIQRLRAEQERIKKESAEREKILAQQRQIAEKRRLAEAEVLIKQQQQDEEERKKSEEEKKVKHYRAREKEPDDNHQKETPTPLPITETGTFLVMKDAPVYEMPKKSSRLLTRVKKYDLFEVLNTSRDNYGNQWHQVLLGERIVSKKGQKSGWTPEEKGFWIKHRLMAWVYPGDITKINTAKPLKLAADEIHYTGKKVTLPDKSQFFEVVYEFNVTYPEKVAGWIEDPNGIRRPDKNIEEMMELMKKLAFTLWPLRIQNEILRGYIRVGFTPEQVILAWGKPNHINKTRTFLGVHEQWVYGEKPFPKAYVYFENGIVKNWEFFKR